MQIVERYPIRIEKWEHLPERGFMGNLSDNGYVYTFWITPEDPKDNDCCYVIIWIEKIIKNESKDSIVFHAKLYNGCLSS